MKLMCGDSAELLKKIPENSIDSIVTDGPYGISFMGKDWDKALPPDDIWIECIRVLKPGGYLISMAASRSYHRAAVQIENLGMIVHPMIGWIYGSGFPKATDLSKQFSKQDLASKTDHVANAKSSTKWDGWKYGLQSLKPALEPIGVYQKPWKNKKNKKMIDNINEHGVGAFNIDACRVELNGELVVNGGGNNIQFRTSGSGALQERHYKSKVNQTINSQGRHPANLLHDGSESVEREFLEQGGLTPSSARKNASYGKPENAAFKGVGNRGAITHNDTGTASRFFNSLPITELDAPFLYTAKASKRERNEGLEGFKKELKPFFTTANGTSKKPSSIELTKSPNRKPTANNHPTVKPIALMEWLVKLVTPIDGTCLDPFMGSGTTGMACAKNNFKFIGIEREPEFFEIAEARIDSINQRLL